MNATRTFSILFPLSTPLPYMAVSLEDFLSYFVWFGFFCKSLDKLRQLIESYNILYILESSHLSHQSQSPAYCMELIERIHEKSSRTSA